MAARVKFGALGAKFGHTRAKIRAPGAIVRALKAKFGTPGASFVTQEPSLGL